MTVLCLYGNKKLEHATQIAHGFFGRVGGISPAPYDSLNCGFKTNDQADNIRQNLQIICRSLAEVFNTKPEHLHTVCQVHGNDVLVLDENNYHQNQIYKTQADSIVTKKKRIAIGVGTADCVPILLYDTQNQIIAAVHAGWRGAFAGVILRTIEVMMNLGSNLDTTIATIGPCISQDSYEVDDNFYANFIAQDKSNIEFFAGVNLKPISKQVNSNLDTTRTGKNISDADKILQNHNSTKSYYFDLRRYCNKKLCEAGIQKSNIQNIAIDTYQNPDKFFSCRHAKKSGSSEFGIQLSAIMLK